MWQDASDPVSSSGGDRIRVQLARIKADDSSFRRDTLQDAVKTPFFQARLYTFFAWSCMQQRAYEPASTYIDKALTQYTSLVPDSGDWTVADKTSQNQWEQLLSDKWTDAIGLVDVSHDKQRETSEKPHRVRLVLRKRFNAHLHAIMIQSLQEELSIRDTIKAIKELQAFVESGAGMCLAHSSQPKRWMESEGRQRLLLTGAVVALRLVLMEPGTNNSILQRACGWTATSPHTGLLHSILASVDRDDLWRVPGTPYVLHATLQAGADRVEPLNRTKPAQKQQGATARAHSEDMAASSRASQSGWQDRRWACIAERVEYLLEHETATQTNISGNKTSVSPGAAASGGHTVRLTCHDLQSQIKELLETFDDTMTGCNATAGQQRSLNAVTSGADS